MPDLHISDVKERSERQPKWKISNSGKRKRRRQVSIRWYSADSVKVIQGITVSADVGSLPRSAQFPHPGNKSCHRERLMPILMRCPILESGTGTPRCKRESRKDFCLSRRSISFCRKEKKKKKRRPWQVTANWSVSQIRNLYECFVVCLLHTLRSVHSTITAGIVVYQSW